jgi:hypothetical protein
VSLKKIIIALVLVIVSLALDILLLREQGSGTWRYFPGFYALFGLIGGFVVIVVSRLLGRYWLERNEEYYNKMNEND